MMRFISGLIGVVILAIFVGGGLGWMTRNFQAAQQQTPENASSSNSGDRNAQVTPPSAPTDPTSTPLPETTTQTTQTTRTTQTTVDSGVDSQTTNPTPAETQPAPVPALW